METHIRAPIVVGLDLGPSQRPVLAWGADEANSRRAPLQLLYAQGRAGSRNSPPRRPSRRGRPHDEHALAEYALREAVAFVRDRHPRLEVSTLLAADDPVPLLRRQARMAAAVVLGSHRLSTRAELFASASVALPVLAHAGCPVVIVRDPEHVVERPPHFVVGVDVGWDGRRHSVAAVDHAFEEAALHRAVLRVLYVWHPPVLGVLDEHAALRECRRLLADMVEGRRAAYPDVEVHHEVLRGRPARVLAEESAHALGLIVGVHGNGGSTGMLLGSVVHGVLHHARCPVVAVPRGREHHPLYGRTRVSRIPRRSRGAVGRCARLLTYVARGWQGMARGGFRSCVRHGGHACRGLGTCWGRRRSDAARPG
ncbi:universal stress protein [Streptomyces sp. NPDC046909]|uniref:universal stress protein n=1 Tax=Streptomyces sp. NPDC046909 TaxID=3155617 RepID=UPI0033CBD02A